MSGPLAGVPKSDEAIRYTVSPLAVRQWLATTEWADARGRVEVALHAVGHPQSREVLRFDCGRQWVTSSSCHNVPEGLVELTQRAAEDALSVLGQCHHHPFYGRGRRRRDDEEVDFFLSHTDWELLEQLAGELSPSTMVFRQDFVSPDSDIVVQTTEETRILLDSQVYGLECDPGTILKLSGANVQQLRGRAEAFVAVTGSDKMLHGNVLAGEVCTACGKLGKRRLHPLELIVADAGPEYDEPAFNQEEWGEQLRLNVRRGYYQHHKVRSRDGKDGAEDDEEGFYTRREGGARRLLPEKLRAELVDRLDVLANVLPTDTPEGATVAELREMLDEYLVAC